MTKESVAVQCPSDERWRQWLADPKPSNDHRVLDDHLSECSECQAKLDRLTSQTSWSWLAADVDVDVESSDRPEVADIEIPGFRLIGEAGRGGHGVVFQARQEGLGRTVAIKLLRHGVAASDNERARVQIEAESLARLQHPHILQIFTTGESHGCPYLVMEWANAGSLADQFDGTPWKPERVAELIETLARALHAAHSAGVIHRDFKPENVLIHRRDGIDLAKISDFGLAKLADVPNRRTTSMTVLGTPNYMAPEQTTGGEKAIGPATDVYAVGIVMYELLTGRPPFVADTPFETLMRVCHDEPLPPRQLQPRIPRDLETICLHCLHKAPNRRYPTALELADDLRRFRERRPIAARPVGILEKAMKWVRRHPLRSVSFVVLAIAIAGGAIWADVASRRARARALVDGLLVCEPAQVERLLAELAPIRASADEYLKEKSQSAAAGSKERLNACLAMLPGNFDVLGEILQYVSTATPAELLMIRNNVKECPPENLAQFWTVASDPKTTLAERLRAAAMLTSLASADSRWTDVSADIAAAMVVENPIYVGGWTGALKPLRAQLISPLIEIAKDPNRADSERIIAAGIVSEYAVDRGFELASTFVELEAKPAMALLPAIRKNADVARDCWTATYRRDAAAQVDEPAKDRLSRQRVRAAIGLWHLGNQRPIEEVLGLAGVDVRDRHFLMKYLSEFEVDPEVLIQVALRTSDATTRRSAIVALGDYSERQFLPQRRAEIRPDLERLFVADSDAGVHSAIEWLIGQVWNDRKKLPILPRTAEPQSGRGWYVTPFGSPMAVIHGPVEFQFGSDPSEPHHGGGEKRSTHRITHSFAIATREVTVAEFQEFLKAHPEIYHITPGPDDRRPDQPVRRVRWQEALQYCRWLCERDGIPESEMPYPPISQMKESVSFPPRFLERTGYRLPTEEEWEFACRSGSETPRFYGFDPNLLTRYGWVILNSNDICHAGGQLRPNDFGLFDIYGNVWEWTQVAQYESVGGNDKAFRALHLDRPFSPDWNKVGQELVARGGSYIYHSPFVRSAKRYMLSPLGDSTIGFRIARTISRPKAPTPN